MSEVARAVENAVQCASDASDLDQRTPDCVKGLLKTGEFKILICRPSFFEGPTSFHMHHISIDTSLTDPSYNADDGRAVAARAILNVSSKTREPLGAEVLEMASGLAAAAMAFSAADLQCRESTPLALERFSVAFVHCSSRHFTDRKCLSSILAVLPRIVEATSPLCMQKVGHCRWHGKLPTAYLTAHPTQLW